MRALPTAILAAVTAAFTVAVLSFAQGPPTCPYGATFNGTVWFCNPPPLIPPGLITLVLTACPPGWSEVAALNNQVLRGTVAANLDVATTGGADTLTPTGTLSASAVSSSTLFVSAAGVVFALTDRHAFGALPWPATVFTGRAVDSRPAFTRVIACQKT